MNPKNPLAGKFRVGASPARESKEQSHAGRAPTIEGSSIGQSGFMENLIFQREAGLNGQEFHQSFAVIIISTFEQPFIEE